MAIQTWIRINVRDAQGRTGQVPIRVAPAAFGATTLPTALQVEAIIVGLFGDAEISNSIVTDYEVAVIQDTPTGTAVGGDGSTSLPVAVRTRNDASEQFLLSIPGAELDELIFDPSNPNVIATTGANWGALRSALSDVGFRSPNTGALVAEDEIMLTASLYNGTRSPMRPR